MGRSEINRLEVIERESDRFAEVRSTTDPAAPVPSCPGWTADDLLWHLTEVHLFWAGILREEALTDDDSERLEEAKPPRPEDTAGLLGLREHATLQLLSQLTELGDDEVRWSWWPPEQTVGFTRRMQTYEATMHRVDAEQAAGVDVSPIPPEVAAGAVDHCVDVMWGWQPDWATDETAAVIELIASDTGDRWLVDVGPWFGTGPESGNEFDQARARRAAEGAQVSGTVTGSAEELALWAWGRADVDSVTIEGSDEAVGAVRRLILQGIQ